MAIAKVHIPDGSDFESEIADLSGKSVFLKTERSVPLRSGIELELFGLSLKGEVVYVSGDEPKGIGVALDSSSSEKSKLEAEAKKLIPPKVISSSPAAEPGSLPSSPKTSENTVGVSKNAFAEALRFGQETRPVTPSSSGISSSIFAQALRQGARDSSERSPAPTSNDMSEGMRALVAQMEKSMGLKNAGPTALKLDQNGSLILENQLEAAGIMLSLLSDRPVYVRVESSLSHATLSYQDIEVHCNLQSVGTDGAVLFAADKENLRQVCGKLNKGLSDTIEENIESEYEPTVEEVPTLIRNSGVVKFQSFKHFVVQYVANISKGAIVVSGAALEPGLQKSLSLFIPGIPERVKVAGRVSFQGEGSIGFMLEDVSLAQNQLAEIAARPPPSKQAQKATADESGTTRHAIANINYRGFLSEKQSLAEIFSFEEQRPQDLKSCKGWLARVLDFLFEHRVHGVCRFVHDARSVELWIHDGGVVFTNVEPNEEQDKLGRMLVLQKKTSRSSLQTALQKSKETGQPIGRTLVSMGEIDAGTLNSAVRYQTMKRVFEARGWSKGKIEVSAWKDPPVRTGLVITSGKSIMVNLIREEVRLETLSNIEEFAEPYLDRVFEVDFRKHDASLGLKKKERRFFEKAAGAAVNLRDLPKATAVTVNEAYRYAILGKALSLMSVGKSALQKTAAEKAAETLSGLKDKVAVMSKGDLFEVLSLHWTCVDREIEPAYKSKKKEISRFKSADDPQLRLIAGRGLELIDSAFEVLSTPGKRKSYRDGVVSEDERKQAGANMLDQVQLLLVKDDVVKAQILLKTAQEIFRTSRGERLYADIRDGSYKVDL